MITDKELIGINNGSIEVDQVLEINDLLAENLRLKTEVENLKCCGNCKNYFHKNQYTCITNYPEKLCHEWTKDDYTKQERE